MFKNVLKVVLALAAAAALYAAVRTIRRATAPPRSLDLPHAVLVVSGDFDAQLGRLHDLGVRLENAKLAFSSAVRRYSPSSGVSEIVKVLLPGPKPGDEPTAKPLSALTPGEYAQAKKFFRMGEWVVPRLFAPDLRSSVVRLDPRDGPRGTLQGILRDFQDLSPKVYSRWLGLGGDAERAAGNAVFGVQTAWVKVLLSGEGGFEKPEALKGLDETCRRFLATEKKLRSLTSPASFVRYYWAVRQHSEVEQPFPGSDKAIKAAFELAKRESIHAFLTHDGTVALVEATTDAEDEENERLMFALATTLEGLKGARTDFQRRR